MQKRRMEQHQLLQELQLMEKKLTLTPSNLLKKEDWSVEFNKAKGRSDEAKKVNAVLDEIKTSLYNAYNELSKKNSIVTAEKVKSVFLGIGTEKYFLLELFEDCNKVIKEQVGITKTKATLQKIGSM